MESELSEVPCARFQEALGKYDIASNLETTCMESLLSIRIGVQDLIFWVVFVVPSKRQSRVISVD